MAQSGHARARLRCPLSNMVQNPYADCQLAPFEYTNPVRYGPANKTPGGRTRRLLISFAYQRSLPTDWFSRLWHSSDLSVQPDNVCFRG